VRDVRTGRSLALKRGYARDPKLRGKRQALLEREYHTLSQLAHPRIIEVSDYGVDEAGPYYVMELLDGSDLDSAKKLPWREACSVLRDVASSLAILHSRGLIHRDVSARNVRRTADGRAKLIDFGAMASMGVAKDVVGTPPFMAPEAVQAQPLDARADLFSLGALGYFILTGRHAFPARRIRELRDHWRSRLAPPSRRDPEIPAALSDLIVQLLALDRNARPQTASEVISRLCAIAELPIEELNEISRAYLTAPMLVGREREIVAVRKCLLALGRGDGGTLLIEGPAGSGRSRLLDACAIEAKLLGAAVLRVDLSDADRGDFGAIRRLGSQLFELMPAPAREAARLQRQLLVHVFDEILEEGPSSTSVMAPERGLLIRELREFVLVLARHQRMLIAVDDFERLDEPSQAVLAAIANKAERHAVVVAVALDREQDDESSAARRLLHSVTSPIELANLRADQTEALMRSVFGDVANLSLIAGRIHALAQGNPRTTMELAQHLVDRGLVRHSAGTFLLPDKLDENELPNTLAASLRARLEPLSEDARELCEVLCLGDCDALTLQDYAELTAHGDARRVYCALDELIAARVVVADAERYRFSQRGFLAVVSADLSPARARVLHGRVERLLTRTGGDVLRRVHHLFGSGQELLAVELIGATDLRHHRAPLSLLVAAVTSAERLGCKASLAYKLRMPLLVEAQAKSQMGIFLEHAPRAIAQLERDSGLVAYRQLEQLAPGERLGQALAKTHERFLAAPEHERVLPVSEAIPELARLSGLFSAVGALAHDLALLESFPSFEPLSPLSPALRVVARFAEGVKEWVRGHFGRSRAIYQELLVRIAAPDRANLTDFHHMRIRLGLHLLLGMSDAVEGSQGALAHADELEASRTQRVSAWRVRQVFHLSRGDNEQARRCLRRAELCQLQEAGAQHDAGSTFVVELLAAAQAGDVLAVRTMLERIAPFAQVFHGWRPISLYGHARLCDLQGDHEGALVHIHAGFALAPPLRHWIWMLLAALHVNVLMALGRVDEAVELGRTYRELAEREQLVPQYNGLELALGEALARSGATVEGLAMVDAAIAKAEHEHREGLRLGTAWECRARIALHMRDAGAFEHAFQQCSQIFARHKHPILAARLARLVDVANGMKGVSFGSLPPAESLSAEATGSGYESIHSRMRECVDASDRARCALTILLQQMESFAGYLYGVNQHELTLLAGLPEPQPEPELESWVRAWTAAELAAADDTTGGGDAGSSVGHGSQPVPHRHVDREGRAFEPIVLSSLDDGQERIAAILVLHADRIKRGFAERELFSRMAVALLEQDVGGVVLAEATTSTSD
jgi:hypothetical protein